MRTCRHLQSSAFHDAWNIAQDNLVDSGERLSACTACLAIDPEHAGANYIAGRLHHLRGETAMALRYLTAARDFDVCPLRATTPIVQAVIDIASQYRIPLVRNGGAT